MMRSTWLAALLFGIWTSPARGADEETLHRSVTLPLTDYLALLERVQSVEAAARLAEAQKEPSVFELTTQTATMLWPDADSDYVDVTAHFEVLVQGERLEPVTLPVTGLASTTEIEPAGRASVRTTESGLELTPSEPGRYRVRVVSRARVETTRGTRTLLVAPRLASVGELELDLPASLRYDATGAVISRDSVDGDRRVVGFTLPKGKGATLAVRRNVDGDEDEKVLADVAIAIVIELSDDGALRHDVLRYRVSRGALRRFTLTLPTGLAVKRLATDEGNAPVRIDGRQLTVDRQQMLAGDGYVVLTSRPDELETIPLDTVEPVHPVRERFLIASSAIAADLEPVPATRFQRVDASDVPLSVLDAANVAAHSAWRIRESGAGLTLRVEPKPRADAIETLVHDRTTLTLLSTEGTLVHRDTFTIQTSATTFALTLPLDSALWSSRVNETWVRAVERDGQVLVPLGFGADGDDVVEIVTMSTLEVPQQKARLDFELADVAAPVLHHRWRVLLPERNQYRYHAGALRPVRPRPRREAGGPRSTALGPGGLSGMRVRVYDDYGAVLPGATVTLSSADTGREFTAVTNGVGLVWFPSLPSGDYGLRAELAGFQTVTFDAFFLEPGATPAYQLTMHIGSIAEAVTVTGEGPLIDTRSSGITTTFGSRHTSGHTSSSRKESKLTYDELLAFQGEAEGLRAGLTSGVKPVPVTIPESGKLISLSGALPPTSVTVTLDVRPQ